MSCLHCSIQNSHNRFEPNVKIAYGNIGSHLNLFEVCSLNEHSTSWLHFISALSSIPLALWCRILKYTTTQNIFSSSNYIFDFQLTCELSIYDLTCAIFNRKITHFSVNKFRKVFFMIEFHSKIAMNFSTSFHSNHK